MGFHTINYKFIAASALTASKTLVYRMTTQRDGGASLSGSNELQDVSGTTSIGITTREDLLDKFFEIDLKFGKTETADDVVIKDAICSVSLAKHIIKTQLVGLKGTIKEYITEGDYEISIAVGVVAEENGQFIDQYPADELKQLRQLLELDEAIYVDSDFLRIFDITKIVIADYKAQQMTHSNRQIINIQALSDDDYTIKYNEY